MGYRKLRLSLDDVRADAASAGLEVTHLRVEQGLAVLCARPARDARSIGDPSR